MIPIIFIGSILILLFYRPQSSQQILSTEEEIYPSIGDVLTVMIPVRELPSIDVTRYLFQQKDVIEIFANRGYRSIPVGSTYKNGSYFQKLQIVDKTANIALPRDLGKGNFIHSIQKNI